MDVLVVHGDDSLSGEGGTMDGVTRGKGRRGGKFLGNRMWFFLCIVCFPSWPSFGVGGFQAPVVGDYERAGKEASEENAGVLDGGGGV